MYKKLEWITIGFGLMSMLLYWTLLVPAVGFVAGLVALGVRGEDDPIWKPILGAVLNALWLLVAYANFQLGRL